MQFYDKTLKKLENLSNDIKFLYGNNAILSHKQLLEFIKQKPKYYPHINSILNKPEFKISRGKYLIQLHKIDDISQDIKNDAEKLLKELFS